MSITKEVIKQMRDAIREHSPSEFLVGSHTVTAWANTLEQELPSEPNADMKQIGELIKTQDNRATSHPMFIVQRLQRIYGVGADYTNKFMWISEEGEPASEIETAGLEALLAKGVKVKGWEKVGYVDRWEFVTACFTRQACEDYVAAKGHDLGVTRIYVDSAYDNHEWIKVREYLKQCS